MFSFLGVAVDLTGFCEMKKNKKKSRKGKQSEAKLGRPEELKIEDLPKRFREMKSFLENYWGRVGLGLRKARQPEDVRAVLTLVQGIEWMTPFKGHAICLIAPHAGEVTANEIRATRRKHKAAEALEQRCWTEYHESEGSTVNDCVSASDLAIRRCSR